MVNQSEQNHANDFNISIPVSSKKPTISLAVRHYLASTGLYACILFFLWHNNWYGNIARAGFLSLSVKEFLLILWSLYLIFALPVYLYFRPLSLWNSKPLIILHWFKRIVNLTLAERTNWIHSQQGSWKMSYHEAQAFGVFFVKVFFGPLMLSFFFSAIEPTWNLAHKLWWVFQSISQNGQLSAGLVAQLAHYEINLPGIENNAYMLGDKAIQVFTKLFWDNAYLFSLKFLFLLDTMVFSFGYFWEAGFLKNRIRSVDLTVLGLLTCLCVYPPFNMVTNSVIHGVPNDMASVDHMPTFTWVLRSLSITMVLIYVSASFALFTKASNLTNRGTVSRGPYAYVRHPAYTSKIIFWLLTSIPFFFPSVLHPHFDMPNPWVNGFWMGCSLLAYAGIYYLRCITEERHLARDPDYRDYMQKVTYRFIPKLW